MILFLFILQMRDSYLFWKSSPTFNCFQYLSFPFQNVVFLLCFAILISTWNVSFPMVNTFLYIFFNVMVKITHRITLQHPLLWLLILCFSSMLLYETIKNIFAVMILTYDHYIFTVLVCSALVSFCSYCYRVLLLLGLLQWIFKVQSELCVCK